MNSAKWLTAMVTASCLAMPLCAQDTTRTQAERMTTERTTAVGESTQLSTLAAKYSVQEDEIRSLREKGWSWNEVGSALAVSKRSEKSLDEIVAQRDEGQSWAQISEKHGFRFSEVQGEAKRIAKDGKRYDKNNRAAVRRAGPEPTTPNVTPAGTERGRGGPEVPSNAPGTESSEELRGTPRGPSSIDQSPEGPGDNQTPR